MTAPELEAQSLVDPLLVAHLDEDWAVPCEMGRDAPDDDVIGCCGQNTAEFILWPVQCCPRKGKPILTCKACLDAMLGDPDGIHCVWCDHAFLPGSTAFRLIEPLNRRTT